MNYLISVIIVSWNRKDDIKITIQKYLEQTYKNIEIIVVDNNSKDGTVEMIKECFQQIKLIELKENTGLKAYNIGFENAKGDIIIVSDDDAYLEETGIEKIVNKFNQDNDRLAIIATKIVYIPSYKEYKWYPFDINDESDENGYDSHYFINAGAAIRREALEKAGYYDNDFFMWMFEVDICTRIIGAGYDVKYFPDITTYHKSFPDVSKNKKENSLYYSFRNIIWYYWKYFPVHIALGRSIIRIPFEFFWITLNCKNPLVAFRALIDIFKGMPNNLKKRKPIPKQYVKKALDNQSEISNLTTFVINKINYKLHD